MNYGQKIVIFDWLSDGSIFNWPWCIRQHQNLDDCVKIEGLSSKIWRSYNILHRVFKIPYLVLWKSLFSSKMARFYKTRPILTKMWNNFLVFIVFRVLTLNWYIKIHVNAKKSHFWGLFGLFLAKTIKKCQFLVIFEHFNYHPKSPKIAQKLPEIAVFSYKTAQFGSKWSGDARKLVETTKNLLKCCFGLLGGGMRCLRTDSKLSFIQIKRRVRFDLHAYKITGISGQR